MEARAQTAAELPLGADFDFSIRDVVASAQIFYGERRVLGEINTAVQNRINSTQRFGLQIEDLPFERGIVIIEDPGIYVSASQSFDDQQHTVSHVVWFKTAADKAWVYAYCGEGQTVTFEDRLLRVAYITTLGFSFGEDKSPESRLVAESLLGGFLDFALSKRSACYNVVPERTGSYKRDEATIQYLRHVPTGPIIVVLRAAIPREYRNSGACREVDWRYRWRVRAHWRNWHGRLIPVRSHIKGPKNLPLKRTVYDVAL